MARNPQPTFSLRSLLAFWLGIALLCAVGGYSVAAACFVIALLYFVLLLVGSALADRFPQGQIPVLGRASSRTKHVNHGPILWTLCYLVLFYCWRMLPLTAFAPLGFQAFWGTPFLFGLSISLIEHCVLILFHVYLCASFCGDCYGTGFVSRWNCGMTAGLSVLLLASHFAIPWA
jgi:hypothetical protein